MKVPVENLISYERISDITGIDRQLLRRWKARGHISPVRDDMVVFEWDKIRPILAERTGNPPDAWAGTEVVEG